MPLASRGLCHGFVRDERQLLEREVSGARLTFTRSSERNSRSLPMRWKARGHLSWAAAAGRGSQEPRATHTVDAVSLSVRQGNRARAKRIDGAIPRLSSSPAQCTRLAASGTASPHVRCGTS